jgi:peptidyl-prolyl cis-trans isomerase C
MKILKHRIRLISIAILLVGTIALPSAWAEKSGETPEIVAVVNGKKINRDELDNEMNKVQQSQQQQGQILAEEQLAVVRKDVMESLISRELLFQESKAVGIQVDSDTVDKEIATIKTRFPGDAEYQKALKTMNLTEDDLKFEINRAMAIKGLVDTKMGKDIVINDTESLEFYTTRKESFKKPEQIKASHILRKVDKTADASKKAEAKKKIETVRESLETGADFAEMAKKHSEGPSGPRGGDLGYFGRGQMVKPFEEVAFSMEPGTVSGVVETPFGYHLIKVYEKKPKAITAYEEIKPKIVQFLTQEKLKQEVEGYLIKLREDAKIERFL